MKLGQVLSIAVAGFLGMGIATAVALFLYAGNRYHLSFGVDSGEDYTVHPSSLPASRETVGFESDAVAGNTPPSMNRWKTGAVRPLGLPQLSLDLPAPSPEPMDSGLLRVAPSRDESLGKSLRTATLTSVTSPSGDVPDHVLRQQSEEIRRLTKQVERLQNQMTDRELGTASADTEQSLFSETTESFYQQTRPRSPVRGSRSTEDGAVVPEMKSVQKYQRTDENYSRNSAEIEELLARMEQLEQQLDTASQQAIQKRNSPFPVRDRTPKVQQSAYVEEEELAAPPMSSRYPRQSASPRPIEMRIVPAARYPRP